MSNQNPIMVSIAAISYKHAKYLRKSLDSVLCQKTNFRYELVIGEDCSNDGSREILLEYKAKYPDTITLLLNEQNMGGGQNLQNVRKHCSGRYIVDLETDDYWTDEYRLQKQTDFLESHPEYMAVGCNHLVVNPDDTTSHIALLRWQVNKTYILDHYLRYGMVILGTTLLRRNIPLASGEKYKRMLLATPTMTDVITRVLLYNAGKAFVLPDVMHAHRLGLSDQSSFTYQQKGKAIQHSYAYCRIVDALEEYFDSKYDLSDLKANRTAGILTMRALGRYRLDKQELQEYMDSLPRNIKGKVRCRVITNLARKGVHAVGRKLGLFYRTKEMNI